MSRFVRPDFCVNPPEKGASVETWEKWLKDDAKAAVRAKRDFTRNSFASDLPDVMTGVSVRKVNGVWKQCPSGAITGDEESGYEFSPAVEPEQEISIDQARREIRARGRSKQKNGAEKRRARRLRRHWKREGLL